MTTKRQTQNFNKIQRELNETNKKLNGVNFKLMLKTRQMSSHWYEYTIYSLQNNELGNIVEHKLFSGKPEAVLGYIAGFNTSMFLFNISKQRAQQSLKTI